MVKIKIVFNKTSDKYECQVDDKTIHITKTLEIETPRRHVIQLPNIPECRSIEASENVDILDRVFDRLYSITRFNDNPFRDPPRFFLWAYIAKFPDIARFPNLNDFVISFYNPIQRSWSFVTRYHAEDISTAIEMDIVNYALEYDLKQFPITLFNHQVSRDIFDMNMREITDEATKKSS